MERIKHVLAIQIYLQVIVGTKLIDRYTKRLKSYIKIQNKLIFFNDKVNNYLSQKKRKRDIQSLKTERI